MSSKIIQELAADDETQKLYPITVTKAVYDEDGNQLNDILDGCTKKESVLDSMDDINANTEEGKIAGALAIKELSNSISSFDLEPIPFTVHNGTNLSFKLFRLKGTNKVIGQGAITITSQINDGNPVIYLNGDYNLITIASRFDTFAESPTSKYWLVGQQNTNRFLYTNGTQIPANTYLLIPAFIAELNFNS